MNSFYLMQHNQDRKHRTYVYTLIVTEILEDWEDSVNIGMAASSVYLAFYPKSNIFYNFYML